MTIRYYANKHRLKENKVHDIICHQFMDIDETVEHMNIEYIKYTALKQKNREYEGLIQVLKCALALNSIDYIIADGEKIDIPPYYEFDGYQKLKQARREEYDEYW